MVVMRRTVLVMTAALTTGCANDDCNRSWCDGNTLRTCEKNEGGEGETATDCAAKFCVEYAPGAAVCAVEKTKRAACEHPNFRGNACDGLELLECEGGYATRLLDTCASAELCEPAIEHCLLHAGSEARCAASAGYCDGSARVSCENGFAIDEPTTCTGTCVETTKVAECSPATSPDPACTGFSEFTYTRCDGTTQVTCLRDYRLAQQSCSNCIVKDATTTICSP